MADEVALKEYFEKLLGELDKRYAERFRLNDDAIAKAERLMNERLSGMNEIRGALKDQSSTMATRIEVGIVSDQVQELRRDKANIDGRFAIIAVVISMVVSALVAFGAHFVLP
jgi:hypothetical protein